MQFFIFFTSSSSLKCVLSKMQVRYGPASTAVVGLWFVYIEEWEWDDHRGIYWKNSKQNNRHKHTSTYWLLMNVLKERAKDWSSRGWQKPVLFAFCLDCQERKQNYWVEIGVNEAIVIFHNYDCEVQSSLQIVFWVHDLFPEKVGVASPQRFRNSYAMFLY